MTHEAPSAPVVLLARWAAASLIGGRERQEDYFECSPEAGFAVVSDGMGGHANGHIASRAACSAAIREARARASRSAPPDEAAVAFACSAAMRAIPLHDDKPGAAGAPGCAVVFAWVLRHPAWPVTRSALLRVGHVGDSRAYWWSQPRSALGRLTRDHRHPPPIDHVLTASIGADPPPFVGAGRFEVSERGLLLLCTDGVTGSLDDDAIARILAAGGLLPDLARRLVDAAVAAQPGGDNATVLLMRVDPSSADAFPG